MINFCNFALSVLNRDRALTLTKLKNQYLHISSGCVNYLFNLTFLSYRVILTYISNNVKNFYGSV
ncbi:hypothetical protein [Klebsiella phage Kpn02]|uniref:Uncharacterized protein n=1 Tax=Klebsiella phage Kpn02 TaxID=3044023 RepID=A0AAT9V5N3_9CAUD|nr:hypothetical protein [Klebsiella phage Kpn02]